MSLSTSLPPTPSAVTTEDVPPEPRGRPRDRLRRWSLALVVVALLAEMAAAMITTAVAQSPTIDEPVYVGTAVVYLEQHSLRYNPEHPPLGKLLIATGAGLRRRPPRPRLHRRPDAAGPARPVRVGQRPGPAAAPGALAGDRADAALQPGRLPLRARPDRPGRRGDRTRPLRVLPRPHRARVAGHPRRPGGRLRADVGLAAVAGPGPPGPVPSAGGARPGRGRGHEDECAGRGSGAAAPGRAVRVARPRQR